jgi:hypothetical protein
MRLDKIMTKLRETSNRLLSTNDIQHKNLASCVEILLTLPKIKLFYTVIVMINGKRSYIKNTYNPESFGDHRCKMMLRRLFLSLQVWTYQSRKIQTLPRIRRSFSPLTKDE